MKHQKFDQIVKLALVSFGLTVSQWGTAQSYDDTRPSSSSSSASASTGSVQPADDEDDNVIRRPKESDPPPPKDFSRAEIQAACAKYKGKLISVYGEVFKLQNCMRHLIQDQDEIFRLTRQGAAVVEVESKDVAALPIGTPWDVMNAKERPCSTFNKKYITFSYTDIYYVENCVRRLVPDYETLMSHRRDHGQKNGEILALTAKEFYSMRQGRDITSIIDKDFAKLLDGSAGVDIIPVDEACKGVEGKIVTFYSRMYKIEKCRKREIDAESFTMHRKLGDSKLVELRPEQWVSMPDGKPYTAK